MARTSRSGRMRARAAPTFSFEPAIRPGSDETVAWKERRTDVAALTRSLSHRFEYEKCSESASSKDNLERGLQVSCETFEPRECGTHLSKSRASTAALYRSSVASASLRAFSFLPSPV